MTRALAAFAAMGPVSYTHLFKPEYVYDRTKEHKKRDHREIGLHAVRGGTIVGEHEVMFAGPNEIISICLLYTSNNIF